MNSTKAKSESYAVAVPNLKIIPAINRHEDLPELPQELIERVIRRGSKLLVTGASKSGKSFLFIELALAIATGGAWCGMRCAKGKVLYVNLEIQEPQFMNRVYEVMRETGMSGNEIPDNFHISNMRGKVSDIESLVEALLQTPNADTYDLVLIDPTYKVQSGSENNAEAITEFCGQLDVLVEGLGCTVAYSHHHSKGGQQNKNAEDRASGSGVFARDADAIIDMIELDYESQGAAAAYVAMHPGAVPFRLEFVLRDFMKHDSIEVWFVHPCHVLDTEGVLRGCEVKRPGTKSSTQRREANERDLLWLEGKLDEYMGDRDRVERSPFLRTNEINKDRFMKLIGKSTRFNVTSDENSATIHRVS